MTERSLPIGLVQLRSTDDPTASVEAALEGVARAVEAGARLVALPEAVPFMGEERRKRALAEPIDGPTVERFAEAAARGGVVLAAGSFIERGPDDGRVHNTSVVFGPDGARLAVYRKIHLFDVGDVGDGRRYTESTGVAPGHRVVVASSPVGRLGLTICFDLRFPALFQALADSGAEIILVPSAFTVPTGRAHWSTLLRARAIETQTFVVAPAQCGTNSPSRKTYGHSMIVDPWGEILCELGDTPDVRVVTLDLAKIAEVRERLPTAANRRPFEAR